MKRLVYVVAKDAFAFGVVDEEVSNQLTEAKADIASNQRDRASMNERVRQKALQPRNARQWRFMVLAPRKEVALQWIIADKMPSKKKE